MKRIKTISRLFAGGLTAFCVIWCVLFVYIVLSRATGEPLPRVFGWGQAVVVSGSMEPEIPVGSLLLIREQPSYAVGDIVTYLDSDGNLVTHRLVSLADGMAVAKGDANNTEDTPVPDSQILGRVRLVLPGVGSVIQWMQSPAGIFLLLLLIVALILLPKHFGRKVDDGDEYCQ